MEHLYEKLPIVAQIDPASTATTTTSDVIDMRYFEKVLFVIQTGAVATSVDFWVNESTATGAGTTTGTGTTALGNIAQLTAGNQQAILEIDADDLGDGYRYIRGVLTSVGAATVFSVTAFGYPGRYQPANDYDLASVAEIATS